MQNIHTPLTDGPLDGERDKEKKEGFSTVHLFLRVSTCLGVSVCVCVCLGNNNMCGICAVQFWLTLQCHSAIFREFIRVKEYGGRSIQRILHVQHILVLQTFVVKVEIPENKKQAFF